MQQPGCPSPSAVRYSVRPILYPWEHVPKVRLPGLTPTFPIPTWLERDPLYALILDVSRSRGRHEVVFSRKPIPQEASLPHGHGKAVAGVVL